MHQWKRHNHHKKKKTTITNTDKQWSTKNFT